jgi:hypothetical protein
MTTTEGTVVLGSARAEGQPEKKSWTPWIIGAVVVGGAIWFWNERRNSLFHGRARLIKDIQRGTYLTGVVPADPTLKIGGAAFATKANDAKDVWHLVKVELKDETEETRKSKGETVYVVRGERGSDSTWGLSVDDGGRVMLVDFGKPIESTPPEERKWEVFRVETDKDQKEFKLRSHAHPGTYISDPEDTSVFTLKFEAPST